MQKVRTKGSGKADGPSCSDQTSRLASRPNLGG